MLLAVERCNQSLTSVCSVNAAYLRDHQSSAKHKQAVQTTRGKQGMERASKAAVAVSRQQLSSFLSVAMSATVFIAICNLPISQWAQLLTFLAFVGSPQTIVAAKYTHRRYFWAFLQSVSEVLLASQLVKVAASPFYSIMLDNSNDISNEDHCLIYIR